MSAIKVNIIFSEDRLGDVTLNYICSECGDAAGVDPTFFETSGIPMCDDCGNDMEIFSVRVLFEETER